MTTCLAVLLPAGNFVSDNIKYIAGALILALLVLLLAVSISQRRSKEKGGKGAAKPPKPRRTSAPDAFM